MQTQELLLKISQLKSALNDKLLRVKGRVIAQEGPVLIQLAPFESMATVTVDDVSMGMEDLKGLTVIVAKPLDFHQRGVIHSLLPTSALT